MSVTVGVLIGKAIFDILKNDSALIAINDMAVNKIQPAPLIREGDTNIGVVYEISSVQPVNVKRALFRSQTAPLYNVTFIIECMHTVYHDSITMADSICQALQSADYNTYNTIKLGGINLDSMQETYDKKRRFS